MFDLSDSSDKSFASENSINKHRPGNLSLHNSSHYIGSGVHGTTNLGTTVKTATSIYSQAHL